MCEDSANKCPANRKKNSQGCHNSNRDYSEMYKNMSEESKQRMNWNKGLFTGTKFEYGGGGNHKGYLIQERGHKCECCGLETWLDKPITLELDHIDGDTRNNVKSNLRLLCPNCHSYTDTWCGKNIKKEYVSDEDFKKALLNSKNIRQALISLSLTPKGANYRRAHELLLELKNNSK